jgi:vitamin B12 transporter
MRPSRSFAVRSLVPALLGLFLSTPVFAVSDEEKEFLELYFTDAQLVDTSHRHPMPVSVAAENITIIDAETIERMNAHTLDDILFRVPGVFSGSSRDFGAHGAINIQGSEFRHVRFLLDGMNMNDWSGGELTTSLIPVEMIQRIEIIKGPASSAWGSSLGGVINIITKEPADTATPSGTVQGSYGEADSQDWRGAVTGSIGPAGYYLYAGHMESDGIREDREFERDSLFSKFTAALSPKVALEMSLGYSDPSVDFGNYPSQDFTGGQDNRIVFGNGSVNAHFTPHLQGHLSFYAVQQEWTTETDTLGLGVYGPEETLLQELRFEENTLGSRARLIWNSPGVSAVLGLDLEAGDQDQTIRNGPPLQSLGAPGIVPGDSDLLNWAVYANTTLNFYDVYLTLGARYDDNDITGGFFSPSLGLTYDLTQWTILRATVSRGFNAPPVIFTKAGVFFLDPNPDLDNEEIWSGQFGIETGELKVVWLRATYFYHDVSESLEKELFAAGPPTFNDLYFNRGDVLRRGIELEARTRPFYNTSVSAGYSYVNITPANDDGSEEMYTGNISLIYDDHEKWNALLWGRYTGYDATSGFSGKYDDFIWNLSVNRTVFTKKNLKAEVFGVVHNIFDGTQYEVIDTKNPNRWVEAGVRLKF